MVRPSYVLGGRAMEIVHEKKHLKNFVQEAFKVAEKISLIFILQLALNAAWSWIFFFFQAPVIAFVDIGILIYLNHRILNIIKNQSSVLFYLYLPYFLWLIFAAFLNASIIWLN